MSRLRVLHFSDVHVQQPVARFASRALLGKRLVGAANLALHRAARFSAAPDKLAQLASFAAQQGVQLSLCSGDFTALGAEEEYARAARCVEPLTRVEHGFMAVPGNHDLYAADCVRDRRFERYFGRWLRSDWPEYCTDGPWPQVRLVGTELVIVGLNSARPLRSPFDSSGAVPAAQLQALERILADGRLGERRVLVLTHYGPLREDGRLDRAHHGLRGAESLMRLCAARPGVLYLHGHIHWGYAHPPSAGRPWLLCAGSATYRGRESFWLYELSRGRSWATPGEYHGGCYRLREGARVEL